MFLINGAPGRFVPSLGTLGARVADIPTAGSDPSPLANDFTLPGDADTEFFWLLKTPLVDGTSGGTTSADDAGGYLHTGAADGSYSQGYRVLAMPQTGAPATADGTINFTVGETAYAATFGVGYAVQTAYAATLPASYAVQAAYAAGLSCAYAVEGAYAGPIGVGYAVQAAHAITLASAFAVQSAYVAPLPIGYEVLSAASAYDLALPLGFAVAATRDAPAPVGFAVQGAFAANLSAAFAVQQAFSSTLSAAYAVQAAHATTLAVGYAVAFSGGSADPAAVWEGYALEGALTPGDALRLILAAVLGRTVGVGTNVEQFLSLDGSKPRITVTYDASNNRTTVVLDGTP